MRPRGKGTSLLFPGAASFGEPMSKDELKKYTDDELAELVYKYKLQLDVAELEVKELKESIRVLQLQLKEAKEKLQQR